MQSAKLGQTSFETDQGPHAGVTYLTASSDAVYGPRLCESLELRFELVCVHAETDHTAFDRYHYLIPGMSHL